MIHYGVSKAGEMLSAHVWVSLGNQILMGEAEVAGHARVATFPEP